MFHHFHTIWNIHLNIESENENEIVHTSFACNLFIIILNKSFYIILYYSNTHKNQTRIFPLEFFSASTFQGDVCQFELFKLYKRRNHCGQVVCTSLFCALLQFSNFKSPWVNHLLFHRVFFVWPGIKCKKLGFITKIILRILI